MMQDRVLVLRGVGTQHDDVVLIFAMDAKQITKFVITKCFFAPQNFVITRLHCK
jgi:hypothetical protein